MWWFAASLRKGGYEGPNLHLLHSTMSRSSTYKQNSLPRSWHTTVLKDCGERPLSYLHVCRILILMAEAFFSFFVADRQPYGCADLPAGHVPVDLTRFGGQITDGAKVGLATELRYREKVMATTWSSGQDAQIRCTAPAVADGRSTSVTEIDLYRSLEETLGPV
jgi:hypothetical protein